MNADPARLRQLLVFAFLSIVMIAAIEVTPKPRSPLIVYNGSGSAPIGWYRIEYRPPSRGDVVVIRPSETLQSLLATYAFLPPGIPLLKRVAGIRGDRVCRSAGVVFVNGEVIAEALERDQSGRALPVWEGCFTLFEGQFFVVQPHPHSFDSRYFGPVSECQIIGVAHPIWASNADE